MSLRIISDSDMLSSTLSDIHEFIMCTDGSLVNCDCGAQIVPTGVTKHINTKKHRQHLLEHYEVPLDVTMKASIKKEKVAKKAVQKKPAHINFNIFEDKSNVDIHTFITHQEDENTFSCDCGGSFKASGFKKHVQSKRHIKHFMEYYEVDPILGVLTDQNDIIDTMRFVSNELAEEHKHMFNVRWQRGCTICQCACGVETSVRGLQKHFNSKKHIKMLKNEGLYFEDQIQFQ